MSDLIDVEVACALPHEQVLLAIEVPVGTTVAQAIERSAILRRFPGTELDDEHVGIFGRVCPLDTVLSAGDRVEIYRDLVADPKEGRRRRASEA